mgnify:CR=1 FL=1
MESDELEYNTMKNTSAQNLNKDESVHNEGGEKISDQLLLRGWEIHRHPKHVNLFCATKNGCRHFWYAVRAKRSGFLSRDTNAWTYGMDFPEFVSYYQCVNYQDEDFHIIFYERESGFIGFRGANDIKDNVKAVFNPTRYPQGIYFVPRITLRSLDELDLMQRVPVLGAREPEPVEEPAPSKVVEKPECCKQALPESCLESPQVQVDGAKNADVQINDDGVKISILGAGPNPSTITINIRLDKSSTES